MRRSSRHRQMFFKTDLCIHVLHVLACVIHGCHVHWIITLKNCTLLSLLCLLSILPIQSVLIFKDLWDLGNWLSNYCTEEASQHTRGYELSEFFLWLSRRENISWNPETSALVLIIFDEQIGMYSLLLGHMLCNSFQWQLLYTLWKKTLLPSQDHRRWIKEKSQVKEKNMQNHC